MKTGTVIALTIGGILAFKFLPLLNAGSKLNIFFSSVDIGNSTIHLAAQNTTNTPIVLNSVAADVQANGTDLGDVGMFTPITIAPNAQTDIPLKYTIDLLGALQSAFNFLVNTPNTVSFVVTGNYNADGVNLPLNVNSTVNVAI